MSWIAARSKVFNRGSAPVAFLDELVAWARTAPDEIFAVNDKPDIYSKIRPELGPWRDLLHRKCAMLEVLRVLGGFESSWKWGEGVDASRSSDDTNENSEAGLWQVSYDSRKIDASLRALLANHGITNGVQFQREMKANHALAIEYVARLLRFNTRHNGPLLKDDERKATWPSRENLWIANQSIYPWLRPEAVEEFRNALS